MELLGVICFALSIFSKSYRYSITPLPDQTYLTIISFREIDKTQQLYPKYNLLTKFQTYIYIKIS